MPFFACAPDVSSGGRLLSCPKVLGGLISMRPKIALIAMMVMFFSTNVCWTVRPLRWRCPLSTCHCDIVLNNQVMLVSQRHFARCNRLVFPCDVFFIKRASGGQVWWHLLVKGVRYFFSALLVQLKRAYKPCQVWADTGGVGNPFHLYLVSIWLNVFLQCLFPLLVDMELNFACV